MRMMQKFISFMQQVHKEVNMQVEANVETCLG